MPRVLDPQTRKAVADRIEYYRELGIYDFYRRDVTCTPSTDVEPVELSATTTSPHSESREEMTPRKAAEAVVSATSREGLFEGAALKPEAKAKDPVAALKIIRQDLGDCTRCKLHKQGRKQIVFGVGNPQAELMFVGEGPGADEDEQGEPFVGRAGQLLNNMIKAMGLKREQVYIANVVKCRPPGNRTPERDECETCSPFLLRQVAVVKPKVVVALGAVAAKNLLAINAPISELRGNWYEFAPGGGHVCKLAVTYHPAFLLRDPRQKGEAWKDLQRVMKELGLKPPNTQNA
jgi:uracil-DNA glycosylase